MIPEQKAKDLVGQFSWVDCSSDAKQCALICVDEILQVLWHNHEKNSEKMYRYYTKVKQEINKL